MNTKTNYKLFDYQEKGVEFLVNRKYALLADRMGLGKTLQTIAALDSLGLKHVLVVCPAIARTNWKNEIEKFQKINRDVVIAYELRDLFRNKNGTTIVSYDFVTKYFESFYGFEAIILDESHYLKTMHAKRTKAVFGKKGLVHGAERVWCLSGTPAPNHAAELWPMLVVFGRTRLKFREFVKKFCNYFPINTYSLRITGSKKSAIPELKKLLEPVMLRRKLEDVSLELPPLVFKTFYVEQESFDRRMSMTFFKYTLHPEMEKLLAKELKDQTEKIHNVIASVEEKEVDMRMLTPIMNSISTYRKFLGLSKVKGVAEKVSEELKNKDYEKVVIFCIHRDVVAALQVALKDHNPLVIHGSVSHQNRIERIEKFKKLKKHKILIANIVCAGTAINLSFCNQIIFIEQDWVPGNNAQAAMRCHRIGQERPVFVRFAATDDEVDKRIVSVLRRKTEELSKIFD